MAMLILKGWHVLAAAQSMGTLINGADAGVAIISSAVAAANATLIRAHQVVGEIDTMASSWAQSPIGSVIGESHYAMLVHEPDCRDESCVLVKG